MLIKDPRLAGIENQPTKPMPLAELSPARVEPVTGPLLGSLQARGPAATIIILKRCNNCQRVEPVEAHYCGGCGLHLMF